jgi:hypothetical protein
VGWRLRQRRSARDCGAFVQAFEGPSAVKGVVVVVVVVGVVVKVDVSS